jgi:hypothetical protein
VCVVVQPYPLPTHTLYCCIGGMWTLRGDYYSLAQAQSACLYYCTANGYKCKIVPYGTIITPICVNKESDPCPCPPAGSPKAPSASPKPTGVPGQ